MSPHTGIYRLYETRRVVSRFGPLFGVKFGVLQTGTVSVWETLLLANDSESHPY